MEGRSKQDLLRAVFFCLTLFCQELGPWKIECTIIPILFCALCLLWNVCLIWPQLERRSHFNHLWRRGFVLMALALIFFYRGLDEDNDYLRINHGLWHLCIGFSVYYYYTGFICAREVSDNRESKTRKLKDY